MGPMGCTETPVGKYQSALRTIYEDLKSYLRSGRSLKSQKRPVFSRWYRHSWTPLYLIMEPPHTWPNICILWQCHVMDNKTRFSPSIICLIYFYPCLYCPRNSPISHLYICFVLSDFMKLSKRYAHITIVFTCASLLNKARFITKWYHVGFFHFLYCCCFDVPWKYQSLSYVFEIFWQFILIIQFEPGKELRNFQWHWE